MPKHAPEVRLKTEDAKLAAAIDDLREKLVDTYFVADKVQNLEAEQHADEFKNTEDRDMWLEMQANHVRGWLVKAMGMLTPASIGVLARIADALHDVEDSLATSPEGMKLVAAYFKGAPGDKNDKLAHKIFKQHEGEFMNCGTFLETGERDVEFYIPDDNVEACMTALKTAGLRTTIIDEEKGQ